MKILSILFMLSAIKAFFSQLTARVFMTFTCLLALSACGSLENKLNSIVNEQFPPINHSQVQQTAIADSGKTLDALPSPSLLLNVPPATLKDAFAAAVAGVKDPNIQVLSAAVVPENQGLNFSVQIDSKIPDQAGTFRATLSGWAVASLSNNIASIRPVLQIVHIDSVKMAGWSVGVDKIKDLVNDTIRRYIDNVNGAIQPLTYKIDPAAVGLAGAPILIKISESKSVTLPGVTLTGTALLIDDTGLHLLGATDVAPQPSSTTGMRDFAQYREAFWTKARPIRAGKERADGGIYLSDLIVSKMFNQSIGKIEFDSAQKVALSNVFESLKTQGQVLAGAYIRADMATNILRDAMGIALKSTSEVTIGKPVVSFVEQLAVVEAPVSGTVREANLKYTGSVKIGLLLTPHDGRLFYRVILGGVELASVQHAGGLVRPEPFIGSINRLVAQLLPHANALLDETPIALQPPDLKALTVTATKSVIVTPASISAPKMGYVLAIPRITKNGIALLMIEMADVPAGAKSGADIDLQAAQSMLSKPITPPSPPVSPDAVDQAFKARWNAALPSLPEDGSLSMAGTLSLPWVFGKVDAALRQNKVAATATVESGDVPYDTGKLRLAGGLQPNCAADRHCSRAGCPLASCSRDGCNYNCRRNTPLGSYDDPFCKTGEAACNLREETKLGKCSIDANTAQTLCNTGEEAKLGACNVQRNAEILACNVVNEAVRNITKIDGIGYVNGSVRASGIFSISNPSISYQMGDAALTLATDASADIAVAGSLHFVPYDIGHLLVCPVPGTVAIKVHASLPPQRITANARVTGKEEAGQVTLTATFEPITLTGLISPPPAAALITQNPQIVVTCSPVVAGAVAAATVLGAVTAFSGQDIIGAIERAVPDNQEDAANTVRMFATGKVKQKQDIPAMEVTIPSIPIQIGSTQVSLAPHWKNNLILFSQ